MININLLPWRAQKQQFERKKFIILCVLAALCALTINFIWHQAIQSRIDYHTNRTALLQQEMLQAQMILARKMLIDKKEHELMLQANTIQELHAQRFRVVELFVDIPTFLPDTITVNEIEIRKQNVSIQGVAGTEEQISELVTRLKKQTDLRNVNLKKIEKSLDKRNKITFHIIFDMALK